MLMSAVESLVKPLLGPEEIEVPDPKEQEEVEEGPVQPAAAKRPAAKKGAGVRGNGLKIRKTAPDGSVTEIEF